MARRDTNLQNLHPVVRDKINELTTLFEAESLPFRLFEGFRSPQRQAGLYAQGRSKPGRIVTKAQPWSSYHQYGVAGDFVLFIDGKWSWDDSGERAQWWTRLHELARNVGLKPLSWELPHLQLQDLTLNDLKAGRYPEGGDDDWAENLEDAIETWAGPPLPPPLPFNLPQRPAIDTSAGDGESEPSAGLLAANRYRVIARSGLRLREGAGQDFDIVGVLPLNQTVTVLSVTGKWSLVDIEGDGIADGYCFGGYLVPV